MSELVIEYVPIRGGFAVFFGNFDRPPAFWPRCRNVLDVCDDTTQVRLLEDGRVAAIESFWDHGGLPQRGLHRGPIDEGQLRISGLTFTAKEFRLRQTPQTLELWFGSGERLPGEHVEPHADAVTGIVVWFSGQREFQEDGRSQRGSAEKRVPRLPGSRYPSNAAWQNTR